MGYLTMKTLLPLLLLCALALLTACSKETLKRSGYGAVKIYNCNEQINDPACSDKYPSYEEYQRERSEIPK
jgi:hypothetical protein